MAQSQDTDDPDATATVYGNGQIHIPAAIQSRETLIYDDEVAITIHEPDHDDVDSLEFTGFVNSDYQVTVPADIRKMLGIGKGDDLDVSIEWTGEVWEPEDGGQGRTDLAGGEKDNRTSTNFEEEDDDEDDEPGLGELFSDDDGEEEEESEGLGELFG